VPRPGPYSWTVPTQQALHPEAATWVPDIGWEWLIDLPTELHVRKAFRSHGVHDRGRGAREPARIRRRPRPRRPDRSGTSQRWAHCPP
jgi:hypothetical protein